MTKMRILGAMVALVCSLSAPVQAAMLIAGNTDGNIRDVDTSVPGEGPRYSIGFAVTGLAVDEVNGILYGSGGGAAWDRISVFDLATGAELVAPAERFDPGYDELYGLEFVIGVGGVGRLFGVGTSGSKAYFIEYDLGPSGLPVGVKSATQILEGDRQPDLMTGLAYVPERDRFYSNQVGNTFWEIDGNTGTCRVLFGLGLSGTNGLGYEEGLLYGLSAGHAASLVYFDLDNAPHQILVADNAQVANGWALTGATTSVVPEPATFALLAAGGLALAFLRGRR